MCRFPIVSVRRLTIRCNTVVIEQEYSCIEHKDGNRTELVEANVLDGKADGKFVCTVEGVEMGAMDH